MRTCKECRFWTRSTVSLMSSGRLGDCSSPKFLRGYRIKETEVPLDGVHVEDDEGWAFRTGPDFGCIHWEAKGIE